MKILDDIEILDVEHMSRKVIKVGTGECEIEYYYTEITNKNANKWEAIKFLLEKMKIDKSEVICIGDNMNENQI